MSRRRRLHAVPVELGAPQENLALLRQLAAAGVRLLPASRFAILASEGELPAELEAEVRSNAGELQRLGERLAELRQHLSPASVSREIGRLSPQLLPLLEEILGPEPRALLATPDRLSPALQDLLYLAFLKGLARQAAGAVPLSPGERLRDLPERAP